MDTAATTTDRPAGALFLILVGVGLTTGILEGLLLLWRRFGQGHLIWAPADIIWMAPLTYAVLAVPLALAALLLHRFWPRLITVPRVTALAGFLGGLVMSTNLFGGRMHWIAHLILSAAVGIQLSRLAADPSGRLRGGVGTTVPWLAGGTVALAVVMLLGPALRARVGRTGWIAPPPNAPNILLIFWDTVRAQNLSLLGYGRPTTPHLERWAAEGTVFEQAMSTAPWTLAGHGSAFTGLRTQELGADWRKPIQTNATTLAEFLSDRGYRTGGFVANLISTASETGLARGFSHYEDFPRTLETVYLSTLVGQRLADWRPFFRGGMRRYPPRRADEITDRFLDWSAQSDEPWLGFLNYFEAHDPYYPPENYRDRFSSDDVQLDKYDGALTVLDADLDRLLGALRDRGDLDNTIVILASDHGELFGEHGLRQHGNSLYIQLLHVPLVLWGPGIPAGARITTPVSLRSLPATLAEMVFPGRDHPFPGGSLVGTWQDSAPGQPLLAGVPKGANTPPNEPVTLGNMSAVRDGAQHYILNGDDKGELYDLATDPNEEHDLADDAAFDTATARLDSLVRELAPVEWHDHPSASKGAM